VFFNILMVADAARAVPRELINASYTLGAGRLTTIRRVIFPWSLPGIFDAARINLAQEGLGYQIVRAQRFRAVDRIFAILLVFGAIGLLSDLALRGLRNRTSPWARS
jgi:NitT/TauT family transport system permease protein